MKNAAQRCLGAVVLSMLVLGLAAPVFGASYNEVWITVRDLQSGEDVAELSPGETFEAEEWGRYRFILSVYANSDRPIYPVTEFADEDGKNIIRITQANPDNSNVTVQTGSPRNKSNSELLYFTIHDDRVGQRARQGSIRVSVVE